MAIHRIVLNARLSGLGFSFNDACLREEARKFPGSYPVDAIEERAFGVRVHLPNNGVQFNIPWTSITYTQGPDEPLAAIAQEGCCPHGRRSEVHCVECLRDTYPATTPVQGNGLSEGFNGKPCPACLAMGAAQVPPNRRASWSFLCVEHSTPENKAKFRKA